MPRTPAAAPKKRAPGKKAVTGKKVDLETGTKAAKASGQESRLTMVRTLIEKWAEELASKKTKSGVAELVRLLALEKEMSATNQTVREIKVSWVEPKATELSKSE